MLAYQTEEPTPEFVGEAGRGAISLIEPSSGDWPRLGSLLK